MPVAAKKLKCCSVKVAKMKVAAFNQAKAKAEKAAKANTEGHTHMQARKAQPKKAPQPRKAKSCQLCGKYKGKAGKNN